MVQMAGVLQNLPTSHSISASSYQHISETIVGEMHMKFKKQELLLGVLLGTGLHLLDSLRERLPDHGDEIKSRVKDTYDTAYKRVSRATDALRGEEDSHILGKVGTLLIGVESAWASAC
jgi:hypothetical protein